MRALACALWRTATEWLRPTAAALAVRVKYQLRPGRARGLGAPTQRASRGRGADAVRASVSPRPRASLPMRRAVTRHAAPSKRTGQIGTVACPRYTDSASLHRCKTSKTTGAQAHTPVLNTHCCTLQDGTTALQMACLEGHAEVVQLLLDSRADANLANEVRSRRALRSLYLIPPANRSDPSLSSAPIRQQQDRFSASILYP